MGILTDLQAGKKIHWEPADSDTFGYNQDLNVLEQWVNGEKTEETLPVVSISEESLTITWGDQDVTYYDGELEYEN